MGKAPAFQLYAADFYMDTADWTNPQVGAYVRLLMYEWINGGLSPKISDLARITKVNLRTMQKMWSMKIEKKFVMNGNGLLINLRLEQEREKQHKRQELQVEKGIHGAYKRWNKPMADAIAQPMAQPMPTPQPKDSSSSSSSSSSVKKKIKDSSSYSDTRKFLDHYSERFKHHFGKDPVIEWGKDSTIIKNLLKLIPIDTLKELLERYFTSEDKFILKSGYTIGIFKTQINKLQIGEPMNGTSLWLKAKEKQDERQGQEEIRLINEKTKGDIPDRDD